MWWIYRLQQRIAITRSECNVILVLALLFTLGLTLRYLHNAPQPLPEDAYAEATQHFVEASTAEVSEPEQPSSVEPTQARQPSTYRRKAALPAQPININTATEAQLQRLPRIGPKMAERILAYREAHGAFRSVQDLVRVRGIGPKTLSKLEPYVIVVG